MATIAQIQANRVNARKSTGPRTAEGKEKASQNALKHGLLAREAVIQGEDPEEFELYREGMLAELAPAGAVEAMLAERVVGLSWRLLRAQRFQNAAFAALDDGEPTDLLEARLQEWKQIKGSAWDRGITGVLDENLTLGQVVVADFAEARVLDRLLMYERRIESSLYRTMAQLRAERQARTATALPENASYSDDKLPVGQESETQVKLASFGADSPPDRAAGSTYQVPIDSSDLTLRTPHLELEEKITPYGVTTNGRDAHATGIPARIEPSCETKPISEGGPAWLSRQMPEGGRAPAGEASTIEPDGRYL